MSPEPKEASKMHKIVSVSSPRKATLALAIIMALFSADANAEDTVGKLEKLKTCYKSQVIRLIKQRSPDLQSVDDNVLEGILMAEEGMSKTFEFLDTAALAFIVADEDQRNELDGSLESLNEGGLAFGTALQACNLIVLGK
jgi:hypothetical protein